MVAAQVITDRYSVYNGDCVEVMRSLPDRSIDLSVYSPPYAGLYEYSSDPADLSNCRNYKEFLRQYEFAVRQIARLTPPGRISVVHCADIPDRNGHPGALLDLPGDIIRLHRKVGFDFGARYHLPKPPLEVRNRTLIDGLAHQTVVEDSTRSAVAGADYVLMFRRRGRNAVPVTHPQGFLDYIGATEVPAELEPLRGWPGKQTENRYSQWIWRHYASACWDDIRWDRVVPFHDGWDGKAEKHVHPLPLDISDLCVELWSNPGEVVLSPYAGSGAEVYSAVLAGRLGVAIELKPTYYQQACKNLAAAAAPQPEQTALFGLG